LQISPLLQIPFLQILILRSVLLLKGEKTMKKRVFALLLTAVMLSMHLTTFAAGWEQLQSGEWMYYNADGSYKTDTWIGNYYVDSSGCMLRNGWTPDGYWVGNDGAWEPQWGQRHDDVAPWPGKPYRGTYTYVFYRDVYGDGVEHWSAKESISFSSLTKTYEMYPVGRSYYMMMDILSGDVYGSVSFSPDRSVAYVNLGGVPQRCEIEW